MIEKLMLAATLTFALNSFVQMGWSANKTVSELQWHETPIQKLSQL